MKVEQMRWLERENRMGSESTLSGYRTKLCTIYLFLVEEVDGVLVLILRVGTVLGISEHLSPASGNMALSFCFQRLIIRSERVSLSGVSITLPMVNELQ